MILEKVTSIQACFREFPVSLGGIGESLLDSLPVYYLPDVLQEVCLRVLVVNVESVLPDIDVKEGGEATWLLVGDEVLVGGGAELEGLGMLIVYEPAPAGALDCCGLS